MHIIFAADAPNTFLPIFSVLNIMVVVFLFSKVFDLSYSCIFFSNNFSLAPNFIFIYFVTRT